VARRSAGILPYRFRDGSPEVLLVHPGGPFWARRDLGAWSIPKGEHGDGEDPLACALRELEEELGAPIGIDAGALIDLGEVRQKSGKVVRAWAGRADFDPGALRSNTFVLEWPPRSGRRAEFPEVDRAEWLDPDVAREKLVPAQAAFVDRLLSSLGDAAGRGATGRP
jgi:predicted NUDIX family NTP pyrophosphohydrolase